MLALVVLKIRLYLYHITLYVATGDNGLCALYEFSLVIQSIK